MEVAFIVYPIFILLSLLITALPIVMGIYIYRDAKKRGMNAVLWTLLGVLAPGFIGLVIYLIVRGEHPDLQCYSCGKPVSAVFSVCPYCGAPLKEKCGSCGYSLESDWIKCASCGADIPEEQRMRSTVRKKSGGLKWLLALAIAIPLLLMLLLFGATCLFRYEVAQEGCVIDYYDITKTAIYKDQQEILDWISECDAKGDGAYVLRTDFREGAMAVTNMLVYRNDGYFGTTISTLDGGAFVAPELDIQYYSPGMDSRQDYTLVIYRFMTENDNRMYLTLSDIDYDGNTTRCEYELTESDALDGVLPLYFAEDVLMEKEYLTVAIDEGLTEVYAVSADLYIGEVICEGETAANADMSNIAGECFTFSHYAELEDAEYTVVVTLYDENDMELLSTEPLPFSMDDEWRSFVSFFYNDEEGRIDYKH